MNGNSVGKLTRRISVRDIPSSFAAMSIIRSIANVASGRPAPRRASVGTVWVKTLVTLRSISGIAYAPVAIRNVSWEISGVSICRYEP